MSASSERLHASINVHEPADRQQLVIGVRPRFRPPIAPEPLPATEGSITARAAASSTCTTVISLPWNAQAFPSVKGVLHQPEAKPTLKQETRDAILLAIAKARSWIDDVSSGSVRSFPEIAE